MLIERFKIESPRAAPLNPQIHNVEHTNAQVLDVSHQTALSK